MSALAAELRGVPRAARWAIIGAASAGVTGAVAGLVIGISTHPSTAWFAELELGIPAAIAGGVLGVLAALLATAAGRIMRRATPPRVSPKR